ncbi:hypothetical protein E2C01_076056 [Portunus trituberculatus]|uniref:Uncharacterized protein n=1 Tax=Portunus trituberculatus TaxID=210409 RepID=A0A5B7IAE4_PORTR|nr:hypothetical protein [Portunus trituberculatus]
MDGAAPPETYVSPASVYSAQASVGSTRTQAAPRLGWKFIPANISPPHPFSSSILFPFCSSFFVSPPRPSLRHRSRCPVPLGKVIDTLRHVSLPFGRHATSIPISSISWSVFRECVEGAL